MVSKFNSCIFYRVDVSYREAKPLYLFFPFLSQGKGIQGMGLI